VTRVELWSKGRYVRELELEVVPVAGDELSIFGMKVGFGHYEVTDRAFYIGDVGTQIRIYVKEIK